MIDDVVQLSRRTCELGLVLAIGTVGACVVVPMYILHLVEKKVEGLLDNSSSPSGLSVWNM